MTARYPLRKRVNVPKMWEIYVVTLPISVVKCIYLLECWGEILGNWNAKDLSGEHRLIVGDWYSHLVALLTPLDLVYLLSKYMCEWKNMCLCLKKVGIVWLYDMVTAPGSRVPPPSVRSWVKSPVGNSTGGNSPVQKSPL